MMIATRAPLPGHDDCHPCPGLTTRRPGAAGRLLAFHGNAGMAVERAYMAQAFGADFEVTVVEYPGFGARPGDPGDAHGMGFGDMLLRLLWVALGDGLVDSSAGLESAPLYLALHIAWVVLSSVLMLNLLIAMMGRTFDTDAEDTHSIWIFPFASLVLRYERMLSAAERDRRRVSAVRR